MLLSSCTSGARMPQPDTMVPPTSTAAPLPASDPKSLALITGNYTYEDGGSVFQFNLFSNENFISLRNSDGSFIASGAISLTEDQITFVGYDFSCESQPGVYKWSLDNNVLHLTLIQDGCKNRADIFGVQAFDKVSANNTEAAVIWEIPVESIGGIATDSQGIVYMTECGTSFFKYDTNGNLLGTWPNAGIYACGVAVDNQGKYLRV